MPKEGCFFSKTGSTVIPRSNVWLKKEKAKKNKLKTKQDVAFILTPKRLKTQRKCVGGLLL